MNKLKTAIFYGLCFSLFLSILPAFAGQQKEVKDALIKAMENDDFKFPPLSKEELKSTREVPTEAQAWKKARKLDTQKAYVDYMTAFTRGVHFDEAAKLADERFREILDEAIRKKAMK